MKNKLLMIFGFAACLGYAWTPSERPTSDFLLMPWDAPLLFFWTLILLMRGKRWAYVLPSVIGLATAFTETVILLSVIPFFYEKMPFRKRLIFSAACFMAGAAVKICCDILAGNSIPFFTIATHYSNVNYAGHYWCVAQNIDLLFRPWINHVLFAVGGIWLAIAFLPKRALMFKIIALEYGLFLFFSGILSEFRLWQEFIPIFFIGCCDSQEVKR